jgi:hypothetical protein
MRSPFIERAKNSTKIKLAYHSGGSTFTVCDPLSAFSFQLLRMKSGHSVRPLVTIVFKNSFVTGSAGYPAEQRISIDTLLGNSVASHLIQV